MEDKNTIEPKDLESRITNLEFKVNQMEHTINRMKSAMRSAGGSLSSGVFLDEEGSDEQPK